MEFIFANNIPIYVQLVEYFRNYIISGNLKPGERLKSVRELALELKVNPNTVQRALGELERLKLVYTERTNGKYVTSDVGLIEGYKKQYADELAEKYFSGMESIGFTRERAVNYLKELGGNK